MALNNTGVFFQKYIFVKQHFLYLLIRWPSTDIGLDKVNCLYLCEKYHQELIIHTKYIPLTKCYYSVQIDVIFIEYFWLNFIFIYMVGQWDFISIHIKVHKTDPKIERDPGSRKFEKSLF